MNWISNLITLRPLLFLISITNHFLFLFLGTIAASMLAFILPSIFYFKTFEHDLYAAWIELWYGIAYVTNDTETGTEKMVDSTKNIQPGESSMVISTKGMFLKLYAFQDYFIPGVMLMFGIVSLVAGLQSIFAW